MFEIALSQFFTFGVPTLLLGIVLLVGWRVSSIVFTRKIDVLVFSICSSCSLAVITGGAAEFPPNTTLGGLFWIFLAYGVLNLGVSEGKKIYLDFLFVNCGLYVLFKPLWSDQTLSVILQVLAVNLLSYGGHRFLIAKQGAFVSLAIGVILIAIGISIFATGSMTVGQALILMSIPFIAAFFYKIVTKQVLKWNRYSFFFLPVILILLLEHYHFSF